MVRLDVMSVMLDSVEISNTDCSLDSVASCGLRALETKKDCQDDNNEAKRSEGNSDPRKQTPKFCLRRLSGPRLPRRGQRLFFIEIREAYGLSCEWTRGRGMGAWTVRRRLKSHQGEVMSIELQPSPPSLYINT